MSAIPQSRRVPEQYDHLIEGSRLILNSTVQVVSALPQSRHAILTALYRDTA